MYRWFDDRPPRVGPTKHGMKIDDVISQVFLLRGLYLRLIFASVQKHPGQLGTKKKTKFDQRQRPTRERQRETEKRHSVIR